MEPQATSNQGRDISAIMRKVPSTDTTPELAFRSALEARGLGRFLTSPPKLPGKPDVVFLDHKLAIFIDGEFWHGAQWSKRGLSQLEDQFLHTATRSYWLKKIRRNMHRDCAATAALMARGWCVLRFWERDIKTNLEGCVAMVADVIEHGAKSSPYAVLTQKTIAEYFAGIGLMRMGLERQGWSVSFANDIDERKFAMYKGQFPDAEQHYTIGDIHRLDASLVPATALATASFPCTDLSLAGGRGGIYHVESSAFWGFIRTLEGMPTQKPPLVLIENVPGFLTSNKGKDFQEAMLSLNSLGYAVDAFILDAAHFVPQSRERLFVVGVLETPEMRAQNLQWPQPLESDVRPKSLVSYIAKHTDIRWRIRSLPPQPDSNSRLDSILDDLPDDSPVWWSHERATYLLSQMSPRHREIADSMIAAQEWSYGTAFRRMRRDRATGQDKSMAELRVDGIAGCLRTPKGGSAKQILFKAGFGKYYARLLTAREAARLMGANDYPLPESLDAALFGFGDAVCVPVVEWVAEYYLNPLVNELIRNRPLTQTV